MQLHPPAPEGRSKPVLHLGHVPYDLIMIVVSFLLTNFQDSDGNPFSRVPYENSIAGSLQHVRNYYRYLLIPCRTQGKIAPTTHSSLSPDG